MLARKIYPKMLEWKADHKKCLVITGQRQVGKTFIIREFAKNEYGGCLEINFAKMKSAKEAFEGDLTVDAIILRLSVMFPDADLSPGTLLFFDEIQDCNGAYSSLKDFAEDGRYDVIASGSLLGVKMPELNKNSKELVPTGYQKSLTMYSLDFEEFLWAKGIKEKVISAVKDSIHRRVPIDPVVLKKINDLYREFMIVGGMPEAVSKYVETGSFNDVEEILSDLNGMVIQDINRYNEGLDIVKTAECFEAVPDQLAESNKKFMYSRIDSGQSRKSAERYAGNLLWIKGAGYGNFCYALDAPALPLKSKRDVFKVYVSDTGMLVNRYGPNCVKAIFDRNYSYNLGAIAENAVAEALMKSGYNPGYFSSQKGEDRMELDFVVELGDGVSVFEVKSGKDRSAPSLGKVNRFYSVAHRVILSEENIVTSEDGIEHLPMFAACFLKELEPE